MFYNGKGTFPSSKHSVKWQITTSGSLVVGKSLENLPQGVQLDKKVNRSRMTNSTLNREKIKCTLQKLYKTIGIILKFSYRIYFK